MVLEQQFVLCLCIKVDVYSNFDLTDQLFLQKSA
jgi:hypothetical protein